MKKYTYDFMLFLAFAILFSSCSKLADISVTKRHYRGGYYVDFSSNKKSEPKVREALSASGKDKVIPIVAVVKKSETNSTENSSLSVSSEVPVITQIEAKRNQRIRNKVPTFYASRDAATLKREKEKSEYNFIPYSFATEENASDVNHHSSTAPEWVIILFCILIPPLGVALKFGIVDKFWICLLLTLIFWLPGAIYALIVVTQ